MTLEEVRALRLFGTDEQIQVLSGDGVSHRLGSLGLAKVRKNVRDDELGLVALAKFHVLVSAVLKTDHSVDLQGDGHPLELFDPAIVVGLEISHLLVLVEGLRLEVQPGRIGVGRCDVGALAQRPLADDGQIDVLTSVIVIYLIAGFEFHPLNVGLETLGFGQFYAFNDTFTLGLGGVHESDVIRAVILHLLSLFIGYNVVSVFLFK